MMMMMMISRRVGAAIQPATHLAPILAPRTPASSLAFINVHRQIHSNNLINEPSSSSSSSSLHHLPMPAFASLSNAANTHITSPLLAQHIPFINCGKPPPSNKTAIDLGIFEIVPLF